MPDLEDAYNEAIITLTQEQVDAIWAYIRTQLDHTDRVAAWMDAIFAPRRYSADWIRQRVDDRAWLPLRDCSLCGTAIGYIVRDEVVRFRSACDCSRYTRPRPSSFDEIADTLARQSSDEIRDAILRRMGVDTT